MFVNYPDIYQLVKKNIETQEESVKLGCGTLGKPNHKEILKIELQKST